MLPQLRIVPEAVLVLALLFALPAEGRHLAAYPAAQTPDSIPFAETVARLSEPGGYFDTDNLISNETGFLHVAPALESLGSEPGGAYLGVGPDQNFSYLAWARPDLAVIVDVRRDNLLHHLLLKALMQDAETPLSFLAALTGRVPAGGLGGPDAADLDASQLTDAIDAGVPDAAWVAATRARVRTRVASYGIPLSPEDFATIDRFHDQFLRLGLDLRFTSTGRAPRSYYPTLRDLVKAADTEGAPRSYLSSPELYDRVRDLQLRGRIIPVVGDLGGPRALREAGRLFREEGLEVRAFYTSNVEFYLFRQGTFETFARSVDSLPWEEDGVIIRSVFLSSFGWDHPLSVPGHASVQVLERARDFRESFREGEFVSYQVLAIANAFR